MNIKGKVTGPLSKAKGDISGGIDSAKGAISGGIDSAKDKINSLLHPDIPKLGSAKIKGNEPPSAPKELGTKFGLDSFVASSALGKGLHYQHNFVVYLDQPSGFAHDVKPTDLSWNAVEVSVPGIVLGVETFKVNGRPRFFASERAEQDLKITFIEDENMSCRRFFEEWMSIIYNPYDKGRNYPSEFKAAFIKIHTTNQNGVSEFSDTFMDIFPYDISDSNYSVSTYIVSRTSITFKYRAHILEGPTDAESLTSKVNLF